MTSYKFGSLVSESSSFEAQSQNTRFEMRIIEMILEALNFFKMVLVSKIYFLTSSDPSTWDWLD